jgi:hypothetical protein
MASEQRLPYRRAMTNLRRRLALLSATVVLAAGFGGGAIAPVAVAKSCSSSYTHAVIGGAHKCLRRGQYCARALDSTYHRYGFHCHNRDSRGDYHLS